MNIIATIVILAICAVCLFVGLKSNKCPRCGGKLHFEFEDLMHGCVVYKCEKCGEEWI